MKRPAPMDFASTPSTPSSAHVPMPMPMPTTQPPAPTQAPVPVSASFSITPPSASSSTSPSSSSSLSSSSSSPDLGQHSPARQRLRLDSSSDTPPGALNTLPVSHPDTSLTMATADTSQLPISSFDPPTPLLASVSLPATVSSSSSLVSSTPNSFLTLTPSTLAASSTSRSPTPTLLSIQQALGNPSPSDPSTASQGVDPDETPRLTSPATLRAANLRAEGMMASPASSAAPASAPASSVPTLPPAWAMPSGATIQQHLAHQLHQAQQQLGGAAAHVPGSSSSDIDEDDGDDQDQGALGRSSSLGEMSTDDRMHVDVTRARGMAVNRAEPAFMTTLAQRHHQQQHAYHEETGGYTSGSSSSDEDEDDQDAAGHNELTAVVAAAADAMSASSAPATSGAGTGTGGVRKRTISTRKRTTSSTSTTASSAAKQRHDDLPHGHLDPISGTPVDLPHPDDDDWDHDTIDFMASVPPLSPMYQRRAPLLPPISAGKTHTLVLDLDETLLHCTTVPMADCGLSFSVDFNGVRFDIYGNLRPGVRRFLRKVAKVFEVVIFTASQQVYAERVLKVLDPRAEYISHVLHRDHCVPILGNYLKDLSVLGRDLRRTLIVDNAPQAFAYHPANGLPIRSWYDDPSDRALRRLGRRLVALAHLDDVRPAVRAMSHVHARLEGVARQSGRVPVGLAMAFSNHDTDDAGKVSPGAGAQDDSMDVDSWGSSGSSSAASNAAHEMMMMAGGGVPGFGFATPNIKQYSLSADAYPQLWQPAVLPPTVQVKLGLASAPVSVSAHMGMTHHHQQQQQALTDLISSPIPSNAPTALMSVHQPDGSVAVVDRSVPMDEDVDLDLADDACADAEVARVTGNYSPSPLLAPASLSSSPYVGASARASLNATPLAERRGNGSPEPLRLTPVQQQTGAAPAPESTLTTPATTSNSTSAAVSTYAVTPSSPANANMNMASMMMVMPSKAAANETPLPTPVTPTFDAHKDAGAVEDRMDVVTSSAAADGNGAAQRQGPQQQQQQVASAEEAGLMAAMAVSE